jgi:hypothetical protein
VRKVKFCDKTNPPLVDGDEVEIDIRGVYSVYTAFRGRVVTSMWLRQARARVGNPATQGWSIGAGSGSIPCSLSEIALGSYTNRDGEPTWSIDSPLVLMYQSEWEFLAAKSFAKKDEYWPDTCDRCGAPAWNGPVHITCKAACCRERT